MGGRGGGGGGKGGGGGGAGETKKKGARERALDKQLAYAKDRRRSVKSHDLRLKWDKKVAQLTHKLTLLQGKAARLAGK